jgi:hypothetical protein
MMTRTGFENLIAHLPPAIKKAIEKEVERAYRRGYAQGSYLCLIAATNGQSAHELVFWYKKVENWRSNQRGGKYLHECPPEPKISPKSEWMRNAYPYL